VNVAIETLTATLGRAPFGDEIAKHLGMPLDQWERMSRELCGEISPVQGQSANRTIDPDDLPTAFANPERHATTMRLRELLNTALDKLPLRHRIGY
jgi:DNA-directed RNA polymerase specialized sigma subunit